MRSIRRRAIAESATFLVALGLTVWSAVLVKSSSAVRPLAVLERPAPMGSPAAAPDALSWSADRAPAPIGQATPDPDAVRWFNGRPVRPARTVMMTVTAYSPDERSCGIFADGQTATLHSVWTNGMRLVAADTSILPFGSMLTVPGYADEQIVPVLDRGGAIKGYRLDLLFPTHEIARKWGVREIPITVWEYADGQPAPNPRSLR